jgi:hypothetical protein
MRGERCCPMRSAIVGATKTVLCVLLWGCVAYGAVVVLQTVSASVEAGTTSHTPPAVGRASQPASEADVYEGYADDGGWLPPCPTEDSDNCYWDAQTMGNGEGTDVVVISTEKGGR